MSKTILSIVIPVYNNCNFTKGCLEDLIKLPDDHEIIVVNNASTDNTLEMLSNFSNRVKVITNAENLGFAKACNIGYAASAGNNVLFLNNDIRVKSNHNNWTEKYIKNAALGNLISATGGLLDSNFNFIKEFSYYDNKAMQSPFFYLSGWCLVASKITFNKLIINNNNDRNKLVPEIWCEKFFAFFEDGDISWRAKKLGIPLLLDPTCDIVHFGHMTAKKMNISKIYLNSQKIAKEIWQDELQCLIK